MTLDEVAAFWLNIIEPRSAPRRNQPLGLMGMARCRTTRFVPDPGYPCFMVDARDLSTESNLEPEEDAWLNERLVEYREILAYLREH